jgi:hypothetical protein
MSQKETVFLSSVSQGLEPYREAVYQAIEGLDGYHCVRMEDFGSRDERVNAACIARVAECTLFVGILGHQYGSVNDEGRSFSEMAYDAAGAANVLRLMFLAKDDFPVQAHLIETDRKRDLQRAFRDRVSHDRLVTFFSSEDELGKKVTQAIHNTQLIVQREIRPVEEGSQRIKTFLLFSFATNQLGYDTGLSISNVSMNPLGTPRDVGNAVLHFYGNNAPVAQEVSAIGAGNTFTTLVSTIAPNFQGYIIAECNFGLARGFAMITDIGARKLMSGYVAEIMPDFKVNQL